MDVKDHETRLDQDSSRINFQVEVDPHVGMIGFIPQGELNTNSIRPPLADKYKVLLPESLSELKNDIKLKEFLDVLLKSSALHASTLHYVDGQVVKNHSSQRYQSEVSNFIHLSQMFSAKLIEEGFFEMQGGQNLLEKLNDVTIDTASAWVSVPDPNEENFTDLWKAKVFGDEENLKDYLRYRWGLAARIPKIKIGFSKEEDLLPEDLYSEEFRNFLRDKAIPELVDNNTFYLVLKDKLPDWYRKSKDVKSTPLSQWEEKVGWPNATYAVDAGANNWPSPILVVDSEDSVRSTHVKYLEGWIDRFKGSKANVTLPNKKELEELKKTNVDYVYQRLVEDWKKSKKITDQDIVITPLMMAQGTGVSDEVLSGPNVSKHGLLLIVPEKVPLVYKKMLAVVLRDYSGLEALDYYTVGSGERALFAFDAFKKKGIISSKEDQEILKGFENWVKKLKIKFVSATEEELKKVGMNTNYFSS